MEKKITKQHSIIIPSIIFSVFSVINPLIWLLTPKTSGILIYVFYANFAFILSFIGNSVYAGMILQYKIIYFFILTVPPVILLFYLWMILVYRKKQSNSDRIVTLFDKNSPSRPALSFAMIINLFTMLISNVIFWWLWTKKTEEKPKE